MWKSSLSMMSSTSCFVQVHLLGKALISWFAGGDDISTGILSHPSSISAKTACRSSEGRKSLQEILSLSAAWDTLHCTSLNVFDVTELFDLNVSDVPPCVTENFVNRLSLVHGVSRDGSTFLITIASKSARNTLRSSQDGKLSNSVHSSVPEIYSWTGSLSRGSCFVRSMTPVQLLPTHSP